MRGSRSTQRNGLTDGHGAATAEVPATNHLAERLADTQGRPRSARHRPVSSPGLLLLLALVLASCISAQTLEGEIHDHAIVLPADSASHDLWLELRNTGTEPCELLAVLTTLPSDRLPTREGRIVLGSGTASPPDDTIPLDAYVEVDGRQEGSEAGDGRPTVVSPGQVARIQLAQTGIPDVGERVIACMASGDYERGRYVSLRYAR